MSGLIIALRTGRQRRRQSVSTLHTQVFKWHHSPKTKRSRNAPQIFSHFCKISQISCEFVHFVLISSLQTANALMVGKMQSLFPSISVFDMFNA